MIDADPRGFLLRAIFSESSGKVGFVQCPNFSNCCLFTYVVFHGCNMLGANRGARGISRGTHLRPGKLPRGRRRHAQGGLNGARLAGSQGGGGREEERRGFDGQVWCGGGPRRRGHRVRCPPHSGSKVDELGLKSDDIVGQWTCQNRQFVKTSGNSNFSLF